MANLPNLVLEWIKKGLDYEIHCEYKPNFLIPIVIPAESPTGSGEADAIYTDSTEGLITTATLIADSPYVGVKVKSTHPFTDTKHTLSIEALRIIGLLSANDYMWVPRYGTILTIGGVAYTVYTMQTREQYHWYKDFSLIPINTDPTAPHNLYLYQYALYKPVDKVVRLPI